MENKWMMALAPVFATCAALPAQAATQIATTVSATGAYSGSLSEANDGFIPTPGDNYTARTVYDFSDYPNFDLVFDFGGRFLIEDLLISADNNDEYYIDFYDGATYLHSIVVFDSYGTVPAVPGGMDTFATFNAGGGATNIGFLTPFVATSARVNALYGDGFFAVGEAQFFGRSAVPEPSSWALMIGGLALAGGVMRRRKVAVRFA